MTTWEPLSILMTFASLGGMQAVAQSQPSACDPLLFDGPELHAGENPEQLTVADLDGDGLQDVVVIDAPFGSGPDAVNVLFSLGGGRFSAPSVYEVEQAKAIAVADFDGDGLGDLLVGHQGFGQPAVLLINTGARAFLARELDSAERGRRAVAAANLNQDAHADVILLDYDRFGAYLNDGSAGFDGVTIELTAGAEDLVATDLDGDGATDVVVMFDSDIQVFLNDGTGAFPLDPVALDTGSVLRGIAAGDVDADGDPDLVLSNRDDGDVSVLINTGVGAFVDGGRHAVPDTPSDVAIADVDGDGVVDLVVQIHGSREGIAVLRGMGDGTFELASELQRSQPRHLALGDLDGDGDVDVAVSNLYDTVSLLLNPGDGVFGGPESVAVGTVPVDVLAVDLDGDDAPDLVTANKADDSISVSLNQGDGSFTGQQTFPTGTDPLAIAAGDLDGDGDRDLAVANQGADTVSILLNNGSGGFPFQMQLESQQPESVALADLDGDADVDLIIASSSDHQVRLHRNQGDGTFDPWFVLSPEVIDATALFGHARVAAGDLDGDDDVDVIVASNNNIRWFRNEGSDAFAGGSRVIRTFDARVTSLHLLDVDNDGDSDIGVTLFPDNTIELLLNQGTGTFVFTDQIAASEDPYDLTSGDIDRDGDVDMVAAHAGGDYFSVFVNNGGGDFALTQFYTHERSAAIALADLDGDGGLDVAVALNLQRQVTLHFNRAFRPQVDCDGDGISNRCALAAGADDCNSNGIPDGCEGDEDGDGVIDDCDRCGNADDTIDIDANGLPDCLEVPGADCNGNGVEDAEDVTAGPSDDCNDNGVPDECEADEDGDGIIDGCDRCPREDDRRDDDGDGTADCLEVDQATTDCNSNGIDDAMDLVSLTSADCNGNAMPDECELDSDGDGVINACDACPGVDDRIDGNGDGTPDCIQIMQQADAPAGLCGAGGVVPVMFGMMLMALAGANRRSGACRPRHRPNIACGRRPWSPWVIRRAVDRTAPHGVGRSASR